MSSTYSIKNIWKIAYPIILGSLAQDIITVVDTMFIGRLGTQALGASALAGILYLSIVMMGMGFGVGVQIIIARRLGEKNYKAVSSTFIHSVLILVSIALFMFVVGRLVIDQAISLLVSSDGVAKLCNDFLGVRIWGFFAAFINIAFRSFYIGIARTKIISITTIVMAVVNVVLDYFLIFGVGIFPKMGIVGAAIASIVAELIALIVFVIYTKRSSINAEYNLFSKFSFSSVLSNQIIKISYPAMFQNFLAFFSWFIFFLFVEGMGEGPLAISNIIRSIYIILMLPIMGFASASNSLISYCIGQNNIRMISVVVKRSLLLAMLGIVVIVSLGLIYPDAIIRLFTNDNNLVKETIPTFYVVSGSTFVLAFGLIMFQAMLGTGATQVGLFIEGVTIVVYLLGSYFISKNYSEIHYVWSMEFIYGLMLGVGSFIYLKYGKWRTLKTKV
jgi:putative MATE family efflux protein